MWRDPTPAIRIAVLTRTRNDSGRIVDTLARRDVEVKFCNEAMRRERSLLYVAASRARDELLVTTGGAPPECLPSLIRR
ncbi:hypothetical protein [Corynebacterium sp. TAE3-ERU16]|uniref:hypothetical protein n=1 Tax=Corynebacterium sp. TAE3-ERU16 TaxID=2849493 RepID=UPI001C45D2B4|nr:hypothetical protein [Corynebacterium sp. TAE3-ERU16]MBV7292288.1 hypothetical protein [Corynebacterium sp. TAE3-ERU16]